MNEYHIVTNNANDKYIIMDLIRAAGATVTGVSGYGSGYYIQFDATVAQVDDINRELAQGVTV
jgi:hypothetical protein